MISDRMSRAIFSFLMPLAYLFIIGGGVGSAFPAFATKACMSLEMREKASDVILHGSFSDEIQEMPEFFCTDDTRNTVGLRPFHQCYNDIDEREKLGTSRLIFTVTSIEKLDIQSAPNVGIRKNENGNKVASLEKVIVEAHASFEGQEGRLFLSTKEMNEFGDFQLKHCHFIAH